MSTALIVRQPRKNTAALCRCFPVVDTCATHHYAIAASLGPEYLSDNAGLRRGQPRSPAAVTIVSAHIFCSSSGVDGR